MFGLENTVALVEEIYSTFNKISEKDGLGNLNSFWWMIVGLGIDIEELASIQNAVEKRRLCAACLDRQGMERFASLKGRRQVEYLAGRWSAKEAFSKAMGTGWEARLSGFGSLERMRRELPYFSKSPIFRKMFGYRLAIQNSLWQLVLFWRKIMKTSPHRPTKALINLEAIHYNIQQMGAHIS